MMKTSKVERISASGLYISASDLSELNVLVANFLGSIPTIWQNVFQYRTWDAQTRAVPAVNARSAAICIPVTRVRDALSCALATCFSD